LVYCARKHSSGTVRHRKMIVEFSCNVLERIVGCSMSVGGYSYLVAYFEG
jgi:hypothetical protein